MEKKIEELQPEKEKPKTSMAVPQETSRNDDKGATCHYRPGYLSERTGKEGIPYDYLVCKYILDCKLKKNASISQNKILKLCINKIKTKKLKGKL
jgi:hypothetical protein